MSHRKRTQGFLCTKCRKGQCIWMTLNHVLGSWLQNLLCPAPWEVLSILGNLVGLSVMLKYLAPIIFHSLSLSEECV